MLVCLSTANCTYVCCLFLILFIINLYHAVAFAANKVVYNLGDCLKPYVGQCNLFCRPIAGQNLNQPVNDNLTELLI